MPKVTRQQKKIALEIIDELISTYQQIAATMRRQATARRVGNQDSNLTLELEASARAYDSVAERLEAVRLVVADSLRFSCKRRRKAQPPGRTG